MSLVILNGCRTEPLASYLSALAVLRLVSEQEDAEAKVWWEGDRFVLRSSLDMEGLVDFFLHRYKPTPLVAPWNGGSGFYEGAEKAGLEALLGTNLPRFAVYKHVIETILEWPELPPRGATVREMTEEATTSGVPDKQLAALEAPLRVLMKEWPDLDAAGKRLDELERRKGDDAAPSPDALKALNILLKEAKKLRTQVKKSVLDRNKVTILQRCRNELPGPVVAWVDAVVALQSLTEFRSMPLLGSGGNEGNLEFTKNFMARVADLLIKDPGALANVQMLRSALFHELATDLPKSSIGQFDPGRAGGYNQGPGIEHKDYPVNPWRFILMMEGSVVWSGAVSRRAHTDRHGLAASPFTVYASPTGYGSAARSEGITKKSRGEVWTPIWDLPVGYSELRHFLSEGRSEVGRHRARTGIQFCRAAAALGVDRGVRSFVRYALLKRRGDSYVALPAGRVRVQYRSESELVRELASVLDRVDWFMRGFKGDAPARLGSARRMVDEATFEVLERGGAPRVRHLLARVGALERLLAQRDPQADPSLGRPLSGLSPAWVAAADDGSPEFRTAVSLASIGPSRPVGPLRANLAPIDPEQPWRFATKSRQVAWHGNSMCRRMASTLARRVMDAARKDSKAPAPLFAGMSVSLAEVAAFLGGAVREQSMEDLLFGLTLVDWHRREEVEEITKRLSWFRGAETVVLPRSYCLLKLLFWPGLVRNGDVKVAIRAEPVILTLLMAGRVADACEVARRRLHYSGLCPRPIKYEDHVDGVRLAAALLIPVWPQDALARKVLSPLQTHN